MATGRIEAFSDGVFAIAITLLILNVNLKPGGGSLSHRLGELWPNYVAFLVSFAVIGIVWINHHLMFRDIRVADHGLVVANLGLLLSVTVIPFPTTVVADAFRAGTFADRRTAAFIYGLSFVALSFAYNLLWLWAARGRRLIEVEASQSTLDVRTRRSLLGMPIYGIATLIALISPEASFALEGALALMYLTPSSRFDRLLVDLHASCDG